MRNKSLAKISEFTVLCENVTHDFLKFYHLKVVPHSQNDESKVTKRHLHIEICPKTDDGIKRKCS